MLVQEGNRNISHSTKDRNNMNLHSYQWMDTRDKHAQYQIGTDETTLVQQEPRLLRLRGLDFKLVIIIYIAIPASKARAEVLNKAVKAILMAAQMVIKYISVKDWVYQTLGA